MIESGRLGNQMFQYCAARSLARESEGVVLVGFDELNSTFNGIEAEVLGRRSSIVRCIIRGHRWLDKIGQKLLLLGLVIEDPRTGEPVIVRRRAITYVGTGYFQAEGSSAAHIRGRLRLKSQFVLQATELRKQKREGTLVFVHVRRGDYLLWPDPAAPAVLPFEWILDRMADLRAQLGRPLFVVLSDDIPFVQRAFAGVEDVWCADVAPGVALGLMSSCSAGVLSPSSFSWWGACLAVGNGGLGPFIAPRFWAGHRSKRWIPNEAQASFLTYV